ncbi:MAG: apolipoprotein N-acyltransferase [Pseudomonadota bacterium]
MLQRPLLVRAFAGLCGGVFAFGYAPHALILPACFALGVWAGLLFLARRRRDAFWIGYCFGLGQFALNFSWIANAFAVREGFSYVQGVVSVMGLALVMALYLGFAALLTHALSRRGSGGVAFALALAMAWTLAEVARGFILTGFPWNPVGALWATVLPMAQFASVAGVFGLSLVTMLMVGLVGASLTGSMPPRGRILTALLAGSVFLGLWSFGAWRIPQGPSAVQGGIELVLVQANIAQKDKWDRGLLESHLRNHIELSQSATVSPDARKIVIWPETAYPYLIDTSPASQRELQRQLGEETTLFFGANRLVGQRGQETARNALFVLRGGALVARYDKSHLVPFGEYVPYGGLLKQLGVGTLVDALAGFVPGPGPTILEIDGLPLVAPLICYEGIFPSMVTALEVRPDWILNISNDAWFGASAGPYQHMNLALMRAIEHGAALVRSTGTGISAVFDPYGRMIASLELDEKDALVSKLPKPLLKVPLFSITKGMSVTYFSCIFMLSFAVARLYEGAV